MMGCARRYCDGLTRFARRLLAMFYDEVVTRFITERRPTSRQAHRSQRDGPAAVYNDVFNTMSINVVVYNKGRHCRSFRLPDPRGLLHQMLFAQTTVTDAYTDRKLVL
jgi:hypothetical protein